MGVPPSRAASVRLPPVGAVVKRTLTLARTLGTGLSPDYPSDAHQRGLVGGSDQITRSSVDHTSRGRASSNCEACKEFLRRPYAPVPLLRIGR